MLRSRAVKRGHALTCLDCESDDCICELYYDLKKRHKEVRMTTAAALLSPSFPSPSSALPADDASIFVEGLSDLKPP
jgi:hypothetical protein